MAIANSPIEAYEQQRVSVAREQGYALFCIKPEGDTPGYIYTVGMAQHQLPELLCFYPGNESTGKLVANFVGTVARRLIDGVARFDRIQLLRAVISKPIQATDPAVTYSFELLRGDDFMHALRAYVTRATRYREELGTPRGVLVLNREDVPSFQRVRAIRSLAIS